MAILLSRNIDLKIDNTNPDSTITVTLTGPDDKELFSASIPVLSSVDVGRILRALEPFVWDFEKLYKALTYGGLFQFYEVIVSSTASKEIWFGGCDGDCPAVLTWRPPVSKTYRWAKEFLMGEYNQGTKLTVYFAFAAPVSVEIDTWYTTIGSSTSPDMFFREVSYKRILKELNLTEDSDDIVAYDIVCGESWARRYIVAKDSGNVKAFLFRNTLGGYDTIYSTGEIRTELKTETAPFTNGNIEKEVTNDAVESWEVDSGYIATRREYTQWQDFLSSSDRYEIDREGNIHRIVIENAEAENTWQELATVKFTYHLSKKRTGRHYEDGTLDAFDYDIQKL